MICSPTQIKEKHRASLPGVRCNYPNSRGSAVCITVPAINLPSEVGLVVLEGRNGTGKTTLLRAFADTHDRVAFSSPTLISALSARGAFFMPQRYESILFPHKPVWWNIVLSRLVTNGQVSIAKMQERAREAISKFGLDRELLDRYPAQLSGGQKQMIALLQAAQSECPLIFLDEPSSALHRDAFQIFESILADMVSRSLVIVATHHHLGNGKHPLVTIESFLPAYQITVSFLQHETQD